MQSFSKIIENYNIFVSSSYQHIITSQYQSKLILGITMQNDTENVAFTGYTLVRLRSGPEGDKRVLFVTYQRNQNDDVFTEHDVATESLHESEDGQIPLKSVNGRVRIVSVGKMKPSFSIFLVRYRLKDFGPGVPAPQMFLSWKRLKNGWPVSYATGNNLLQATYAERQNLNGWTGQVIDPTTHEKPMKRLQFDTEREGPSHTQFECALDYALSQFKKEKSGNSNTDFKKEHITNLTAQMPTIDQVLCEHTLWKNQGFVSFNDVKIFFDYGPSRMFFETLFE